MIFAVVSSRHLPLFHSVTVSSDTVYLWYHEPTPKVAGDTVNLTQADTIHLETVTAKGLETVSQQNV